MRLICTLDNQKHGYQLSSFLMQQGIDNELDITTNTEWDSPDYGHVSCKVWVYDEDRAEEAIRSANEFLANPDDPRFHLPIPALPIAAAPASQEALESEKIDLGVSVRPHGLGKITLLVLLFCTLMYLIAKTTVPESVPISRAIPPFPVITPQINKDLMYDYPHAFEYIDRIIKAYGLTSLQNPNALPKAGQYLLQQYQETPYWHGIYPMVIEHLQKPAQPWVFDAPMFEKIREGEWWRLFTPCLLHYDFFHLFFNMIWLIILGKQIENRMGKLRYISFILVTAIFSNTAQYLMSGFSFLGFSGVVSAMLAFIWVRQRRAAWEGYHLDRGSFAFVAFFILFLLSLQIVSFFLEVYAHATLPIGAANTAHLAGVLIGWILARMRLFEWKYS